MAGSSLKLGQSMGKDCLNVVFGVNISNSLWLFIIK
jgi:hypothetical protein